MRLRWRMLAIVAVILVTGYVVAFIVTDQQRERTAAEVLALADEVQSTCDTERVQREAGEPREVISVTEMNDLLAPFGKALQEDPLWAEFSESIGARHTWDKPMLGEAQQWLESHEEVLAQARAIADRHITIDNENPLLATKMLSAESFLKAGYVIILAAILEQSRGDIDAAFADIMRVLEIAEVAGSPHALIWQAIRRGLYENVLDRLPELVPDLSESQRGELAQRLEIAHGRAQYVASAAGEMAIPIEYHASLTRTPLGIVARPWLNANLVLTMNAMPLLVEAARDPFNADTILVSPPRSRMPLFFRMGESQRDMLFQNYAIFIQDQAMFEAKVDLVRVAMAIIEHREETGNPPDILDELAPRMGGAVPLDPFTEKPFTYQRLGEFFELRGTSPNGGNELRWRGN